MMDAKTTKTIHEINRIATLLAVASARKFSLDENKYEGFIKDLNMALGKLRQAAAAIRGMDYDLDEELSAVRMHFGARDYTIADLLDARDREVEAKILEDAAERWTEIITVEACMRLQPRDALRSLAARLRQKRN